MSALTRLLDKLWNSLPGTGSVDGAGTPVTNLLDLPLLLQAHNHVVPVDKARTKTCNFVNKLEHQQRKEVDFIYVILAVVFIS